MRKIIVAILFSAFLVACGTAYNSQLKQVELGMTKQEIVSLMGDKYTTKDTGEFGVNEYETIEYKDRYKYHWFFMFESGKLIKWWKEKE